MSALISCQIEGRLGIVTLACPPVNALTVAMVDELRQAQDQLAAADVSVVVIRSDVPKFFVAGADLKLLGEAEADGFAEYVDHLRSTIERFAEAPYLTIAAIDGHALGGGLELALACTMRFGGSGASVGLPEIKLGVLPGAGGTQRIARLLSRGNALDLLLTGRSVDADEALRLGIVDRLAPSGVAAGEAAVDFARELADGPRDAFQAVVRCVDAARDQVFGSGMAIERDEVLRLFASPDGREGVAAFLEKRVPSFGS